MPGSSLIPAGWGTLAEERGTVPGTTPLGRGRWTTAMMAGRGEAQRRWKSGLHQLSSGEQERRRGLLLSALSRLDGGDHRRRGDDEALESLRCLWRDRSSRPFLDRPPEELRVLERLSAHFEPALRWPHDVSRSSEGPSCCRDHVPQNRGTRGWLR